MDLSGWQVIVVEDELDSAALVAEILGYHGVTVHVARNGVEALAALDGLNPTLVVTDLAMPEMDGWQTLHELRTNPDTAHIPVVAITAYHSSKVAHDAEIAGFDAYFAKPFNPEAFITTLTNVVA